MRAIYKREMRSYFTSPIGYIVSFVMLLLLGLYFSYMYRSNYTNISFVFNSICSISLLVCPIITMRLLSEDKRQKIDQLLLTAPIKLWKIIYGKFFAALTLYMVPFAVTVLYQIILMLSTGVNWLAYLTNLFGIALLGASILAIGIFISALTESQIIAGIFGIVVSFFIMQIDYFSQSVNAKWFTTLSGYISFTGRFNTFTTGAIDFSNIIFFVSVTVFFLYLATAVLDKKRWA